MPQAIADPEELKRFANLLKQFNTDLVDRTNSLAGHLESLSVTWRDQENKKFVEQFIRYVGFVIPPSSGILSLVVLVSQGGHNFLSDEGIFAEGVY